MKLQSKILLVSVTFLITLTLAIALQGVFAVKIDPGLTGPLNLGGNRIINLGAPAASTDAVTQGWAQKRVSGTCPGSIIRQINANGTVLCN